VNHKKNSSRIQENEKAIDFSVKDYLGRDVKLSDYYGQKILLTFFRFASCPFCNLRMHQLIERSNYYKKRNTTMITDFESPANSIMEFAGKQNPPFPVIGDPEQHLYTKYRVEKSLAGLLKGGIQMGKMFDAILKKGFIPTKIDSAMHRIPADFLIDEGQTIRRVHYGTDISDHISYSEIEEFLKFEAALV